MQESRRKTEFLAILSHELRNPLAPITNAVQVMRMSLPASDAKAFGLDIIARQSHQLHRIVDDLLDLSRASTNKMEMRTTRTNLTETIRTAIETSQSLMESQQHHFTANLPDKIYQLLADHARIAQAVSNLLNNATRYTPAGGNIDLTLRQDGNDALITIKDSGVGISRKNGIYFRAVRSSRKAPKRGTRHRACARPPYRRITPRPHRSLQRGNRTRQRVHDPPAFTVTAGDLFGRGFENRGFLGSLCRNLRGVDAGAAQFS